MTEAALPIQCLSLESPRWAELTHAYGSADDIPELLAQLEGLPGSEDEEEPWFSLWSSLAHQNDVYDASFAAVPHVVQALSRAPGKGHWSYFQFPAVVEAWRQQSNMAVPDDLKKGYFDALAALPRLVAAASQKEWDGEFLNCALAAIAAAKGFGALAEVILDLPSDPTPEFLDLVREQ